MLDLAAYGSDSDSDEIVPTPIAATIAPTLPPAPSSIPSALLPSPTPAFAEESLENVIDDIDPLARFGIEPLPIGTPNPTVVVSLL